MNTGCERRRLSKPVLGIAVCGCFAGLLLTAGCKKAVLADTKGSEQAVRTTEALRSKAAAARDLGTVLSYYADDAVVLPANAEMLTNHPDMQKSWMGLLAPGVDLSWTVMYVEAAKSGDLVYDLGSYTMTTKAAKGSKAKPANDHGKYLAVWKQQTDGSWKVESDMWNSDLPAKGK